MFVVKLPSETKNTKLSFAHFTGYSFIAAKWWTSKRLTAKISVQQNNAHTIYSLKFEEYLCVILLFGGC
jgi:hypothetical protein